MTAQEVKQQIEQTAEKVGMSHNSVADKYANAIPRIQSDEMKTTGNSDFQKNMTEMNRKHEEQKKAEEKQEIISLFRDELGIDAEDDVIFEGAVLYAKDYATIKDEIK